jgi:hypothetical protein
VDAAHVPPPIGLELTNPKLRKGDMVMMHSWCFHEAWPNNSAGNRFGLYMKFHASNAPPAVGPMIHPTAGHAALSARHKHVIPYHRADGRFAGVDRRGTIRAHCHVSSPHARF